jgi:hypothetical protein
MAYGTKAKTKIEIGSGEYLATNIRLNLAFKRRFLQQHLLHRLGIRPVDLADTDNLNNYTAVYYQRLATMQAERLPPGTGLIAKYITGSAVEDEIVKRSKEQLIDELVRNPMLPGGSPRAMVTALVDSLLEKRGADIASVANIGAFLDTQCAYLAPRHPRVSFLSVDRYGDLATLNRHLPQSPNWTFRAGYALDMLADGSLRADLMFMTSTSVCFTCKEFARYIELFARSCRFLVFNEPWWPSLTSLKFWEIPRPEDVDPTRPLLGLHYFNFQNNYIYHLEKNAFRVNNSRLVSTAGGAPWYTLQIIAEKT